MSDFDSCQFIVIRMAYKVSISARSDVTFDISLHEVCVRVGVRYVITKFSPMDSLLNFLTHSALLASYCGFYSSCGELDIFEALFLIRFGRKTVCSVAGHRLKLLQSLICTAQTLSYERFLKYGQETEQRPFKFETAKKVGSSGLVR